jgi:hypothetical protein
MYYNVEFSTQHPNMRIYARDMESAARKASKYMRRPSSPVCIVGKEVKFDTPTVTRAWEATDLMGYVGTILVSPDTEQ